MKKARLFLCAMLIGTVIATLALGADQIIQATEKMVGANHPTLADTLNRGFLIQHNAEGIHTIVPYATLTGVPTTFPWDNLTGTPTTLSGYGITDNLSAIISLPWDNITRTLSAGVTDTELSFLDNVTSSIQGQLGGKQSGSSTLGDLSDGVITTPLVFNDDVYAKFGTDNDFRIYYKAADSTLVIALDNGDSVCSFSKTGVLACTGEIVASQYSTTATDNQFFVQVANSGTPPIPATDNAGMIWFSTADNTLKVTNSDGAVGSITVTFP